MQSLAIRYSLYFNKKYERRGHLFENKFVSKNIEDIGYFMHVCKYVHRNPEKAGISKTQDYNWSSFREYKGKDNIINKKTLLHYFDNDLQNFIKYTLNNDDKADIVNLAEFEIITKLNDEDLANIIKQKYDLNRPDEITLLEKEEKEKVIAELKEISGIKLTQVSRVIKINRKYLSKIWNKNNI